MSDCLALRGSPHLLFSPFAAAKAIFSRCRRRRQSLAAFSELISKGYPLQRAAVL